MIRSLAFSLVALAACGGGLATEGLVDGGKPGPDASIVETGVTPGEGGTCPTTLVDGCTVRPLACLPFNPPTLDQFTAKYQGLSPTDACPDGIWSERYESCGIVAIHSFAGPPSTYWFDAKTGKLLAQTIPTDTGCTGYGVPGFPCDGLVTCQHLCGATSTTIESPMCPPAIDAGGPG